MLYYLTKSKEVMTVGLVTRRSQQLDKLFDKLAVDPKKKPKDKDDKDEKNTSDK